VPAATAGKGSSLSIRARSAVHCHRSGAEREVRTDVRRLLQPRRGCPDRWLTADSDYTFDNDFSGFVSWRLCVRELVVNAGKHDFVLVKLMFSYALERG
jgi:hypothetical protein